MIRILLLLTLAASLACSSARTKSNTAVPSSTGVSQTSPGASDSIDPIRLEGTMNQLKQEIQELESLEENVYSKSIKGDPILEKQLKRKIAMYGSVETLQANLRALDELKTQNH